MRSALALATLLATMGLAGCIGTGPDAADVDGAAAGVQDLTALSDPIHDILPVEELWIESSVDGKRMHNAVYRPDTDEPVPVFINFSPYWGDTAEEGGDNFATWMVEEFVPRGYAVVLSAVRGTGHSEGCFQIGGDQELQDTYDVIDHFANADWSNGNVAAGGKSYDSTTQNGLIAKVPHEDLKGIFHVSGITDMYRYNYRMGVPYGHGTLFNTYYYLQGTDEYGASFLSTPDPEGAQEEDADTLARAVDDAACTEFPQMQASGLGSGAHGMKDDYWIERDWNRYITDTTWNGSIFFVHGHQDWNVKPDHILPWLHNLPQDIQVRGWLHQDTDDCCGGHVYPMRADWSQEMLRWMDHELKGIDTGFWAEPAYESEGTDGQWRTSDVWPPARADAATVLTLDAPTAPDMPGTMEAATWALEVPRAQLGEGDVRLVGEPRLTLTVTSDHEDPVLTATLYSVDEDGERTWLNEAVLRALYRGGLEEPQPITPGDAMEVTLPFYPQDDIVPAGHDLVLELGGMTRHAQPQRAQVEGVMYDAGDTVELVLPLMDPTEGLLEEQPEPEECFAC